MKKILNLLTVFLLTFGSVLGSFGTQSASAHQYTSSDCNLGAPTGIASSGVAFDAGDGSSYMLQNAAPTKDLPTVSIPAGDVDVVTLGNWGTYTLTTNGTTAQFAQRDTVVADMHLGIFKDGVLLCTVVYSGYTTYNHVDMNFEIPTLVSDGGQYTFRLTAGPFVQASNVQQTIDLKASYIKINIDNDNPVLSTPVWYANPIIAGQNTRFTVAASDPTSAVEAGEYFIGSDPGVGNATPLVWDGHLLREDNFFGATFQPGAYAIGMRARDIFGHWSSTLLSQLVIIAPDTTAPILGVPTWTANPLSIGQNTTLRVSASDNSGTVSTVKYSIDGGSLQAMTYNSSLGVWEATFGSNLNANSYNVDIVAADPTGNTSTVNDILAVYNAANGYVTGHAKLSPTSSDTMPISLDTSNNPAEVIAGFTNVTSPATGSFDVNYIVKNNKDEFTLSSTAINWVVVSDSTHASILGRADLSTYVNGNHTTTQNVSVRFDITLGSGGAPDHLMITIFAPNANPGSDAPLYTISEDLASSSNLMIHP